MEAGERKLREESRCEVGEGGSGEEGGGRGWIGRRTDWEEGLETAEESVGTSPRSTVPVSDLRWGPVLQIVLVLLSPVKGHPVNAKDVSEVAFHIEHGPVKRELEMRKLLRERKNECKKGPDGYAMEH